MCDSCLDMAAGKMKEKICYKRHYWDNWRNQYMGCILSGTFHACDHCIVVMKENVILRKVQMAVLRIKYDG